MEITAQQIAAYINGTVEGDANAVINNFAKIEEGVPGAISFLANPQYEHFLYETRSSVVLVNEDFKPAQPVSATLIRVKNAYESVARLLQIYESMKPKRKGIDPLAFISPKATIGKDCYVGAFAYVADGVVIGDNTQIYPSVTIGEGATVGSDCILYPHVTVYYGCKIGNRCILHAGSVVGADGFGFAPTPEGYNKIPQIGIAELEDDVEIGANTCIDRSTMGRTIVRKGVKLDNLVQVAHNVEVGSNTVISAQSGIAGSTKVGSWCMFGGQSGISGHITIGNKVNLAAKTGVISSVEDGATMMGYPAIGYRNFLRSSLIYRDLPELSKTVRQLEKEIEELKARLGDR